MSKRLRANKEASSSTFRSYSHSFSCLRSRWDFALEDVVQKQSRGRRGNLNNQHSPLGFASFVKDYMPSRNKAHVDGAPAPRHPGIPAPRHPGTPAPRARSLCPWTLQPGNITSAPTHKTSLVPGPVPWGNFQMKSRRC